MKRFLDSYTIPGKFRHPWGTVPGIYYGWDNPSSAIDNAVITYMLGSRSQCKCRDGSHKRQFDVDRPSDDGTYHFADESLEAYAELDIDMEHGGV